jgi:hypothetical protein
MRLYPALLTRWVRWLVHGQGLPLGHVALVLGIPEFRVEKLAAWNGRGPRPIHSPPRHRGSQIRAETATKIRRLAELGYDPGRIAALLTIRRADVVDFLDRTRPVRKGKTVLSRPRDRSEQAAIEAERRRRNRERARGRHHPPDDWGYRDQSPRDAAPAAVEALSGPAGPTIAPATPPELPRVEIPGDAQAGPELPPAEDWGRWGADPIPAGSRHPRSVLTYDLAESIRAEWARGGITQRALALRWSISLATLKRVLSGRSYAEPDSSPAAPPAEPMPAKPRKPRPPRARPTICRDWTRRDEEASAWIAAEAAMPAIVAPPAVEVVRRVEPATPATPAENWAPLCGGPPLLDDAQAAAVVAMRSLGMTWSAIGREFGVSHHTARSAAVRHMASRSDDPTIDGVEVEPLPSPAGPGREGARE